MKALDSSRHRRSFLSEASKLDSQGILLECKTTLMPEEYTNETHTQLHAAAISVPCLKREHDFFAFLLKKHGKAKALCEGKNVHAQITSLGHDDSTFLANWLVEMYGNCGSIEEVLFVFGKIVYPNVYSFNILLKALSQNGYLDEATDVFWEMPYWDIVSWNAMIKGFSQGGHYSEALDFYNQMLSKDLKPDKITLVSVLNSCSNLASFELGLQIHSSIMDHGFELDIMVGTSLITMYGRCGKVAYARSVFNRLTCHDVVCWNAMIKAYAENRYSQEALFLLSEMQCQGVHPNNISFLCVLDACTGLEHLLEGKKIHVILNNSGVGHDIVLGNALLNMYGKCRSLADAESVFERMPSRGVVSWNVMITVRSVNGDDDGALCLFDDMQSEGLKPDNVTFVCVINACANISLLEEGQVVHHIIVHEDSIPNTQVENVLINMYGKCISLDDASKMFSEICSRDVFSWNVMITAFLHNGKDENAVALFQQMQLEGILPDRVTLTSVLDACASINLLGKGKEIHLVLMDHHDRKDVLMEIALITMYGKCADLQKAQEIFERAQSHNIVIWNAFISVQVENGLAKKALNLFYTMQYLCVVPDKVSFSCAIDACASLSAFDDGEAIYHSAIEFDYERDLVFATALINMYGKCGSIGQAKCVFYKMWEWDVVLCNAMISAFAQSGDSVEAIYVFLQMQLYGIKPDQITYVSILTVCSHSGEIDLGVHVFASAKNKDQSSRQFEDHCTCMIDILGRAGHLDMAETFIQCMSLEKSGMAWLTLLGACRIHGDMQRGMHAAERCFESTPENSASYVALSNIYVESAIWGE